MSDKVADLAGPGISTYEEVEKTLPNDYRSLLNPRQTQEAITAAKRYIEDGLCRELNLIRVEVPLIVSKESGVNDYLDRDGSRTPIDFECGLGLDRHDGSRREWNVHGRSESIPEGPTRSLKQASQTSH